MKGSWPWPWSWIGSYCIPSCITHRPLYTYVSNFIEIKETACGRGTYVYTHVYTHVRTYVHAQTDGHLRPALLNLLWRVQLKWVKSADSPSFVALAFLNGVVYRNSDFNRFICDDLATSCKNLVNFGPVTPEFKKGKDVHPLIDQQFGYAGHC